MENIQSPTAIVTIIILDDTTSAVDMETESRIQEALAHLPKKKTVFIIAHRISSVKDAEMIQNFNEKLTSAVISDKIPVINVIIL